jgi:hypothetical protein
MNFTQDQYVSGYFRAIAYFSVAIGCATAIQIGVMFGVSTAASGPGNDNYGLVVAGALLGGILAILISGTVAAVVTLMLGLALANLARRILRGVEDWRRHVAVYFSIGAVAALLPVGLIVWGALSGESFPQLATDWLTILDLLLMVLIAGASVAASWYHVWRHPAPIEASATLTEVGS